jgi:oligopeptide/dipeptide ABC transporter ATP-binding protein
LDTSVSVPLLTVEDLRVRLHVGDRLIAPVDGVSFSVERGDALGIVGESGSGKSLTLRSILGLLPPGGEVEGIIRFSLEGGTPDAATPEAVRGHGAAMIFQEPMTALNPTMRVGDLIAEGVRSRRGLSGAAARRRAVELLRSVGVPDPERRARMFPHQLSGGLRQRVMIAAALSTEPELLLCDEPTTALDVTIQDQILGLLAQLRRDLGTAIVFVTHDLAVIAEVCDTVAVMYAGRIVEYGSVDDVLASPRHPYTSALIGAAPSFQDDPDALDAIGGRPPDPRAFPPGCRFAPRCTFARDDCREAPHRLAAEASGHATACIHPDVLEGSQP